MYKTKKMECGLKDYLSQLRSLLLEFGIKTSGIQKKEEYTRSKDSLRIIGRCIRISNKESIINFCRKIGFNNKNKSKIPAQAFRDNIYK